MNFKKRKTFTCWLYCSTLFISCESSVVTLQKCFFLTQLTWNVKAYHLRKYKADRHMLPRWLVAPLKWWVTVHILHALLLITYLLTPKGVELSSWRLNFSVNHVAMKALITSWHDVGELFSSHILLRKIEAWTHVESEMV